MRPPTGANRPFAQRSERGRPFLPKLVRRPARLPPKGMAKVSRVAKPQCESYVLDGHLRFAQIPHSDVDPEFMGQLPKRSVLAAKLPPQGAGRCLEQLRDLGEGRPVRDIAQEHSANLAGRA